MGVDSEERTGVETSRDSAAIGGIGTSSSSFSRVDAFGLLDSFIEADAFVPSPTFSVAIYYVGTLIGGFAGGWLGDKIGRIKT